MPGEQAFAQSIVRGVSRHVYIPSVRCGDVFGWSLAVLACGCVLLPHTTLVFFLLSSLTLCIVRFNRSAHRFRTRVFVNSGECGLGEGGGDERKRERTMGYRLRNASEMTSAVNSRPLFDTETLSKPERVCEWPP